MSSTFDHEKLHVYQEAIKFVAWTDNCLKALPKNMAVHGQMDRAATSIPLNIAEGNGKYTAPDRCRFFDIARGSALECAACLDVLTAKNQAVPTAQGKEILGSIVSMLTGLIRSTSSDRVHEGPEVYEINESHSSDETPENE